MFNQTSTTRLTGIDPRLVKILELTRQRTGIPFEISEGLRTSARQKELVASGKSQTMNSKHITGNATDIHILNPDGSANWNFEAYRPIADMAKTVAGELGYQDFRWGGDWETLKDGVHFQIGGNHASHNHSKQNAIDGGGYAGGLIGSQGADKMEQPERQLGLLGQFLPEKAQSFLTPDRIARAQLAFEGMTLNPNPGIIHSAQQRLKSSADSKQSNKTVEWLKAQGRNDLAHAVQSGAIDGKSAAGIVYRQHGNNAPASVKEYEYAKANGFAGTFQEWKNSGGSNTTSAIREFEYARSNGFQGSFEDWKASGGGSGVGAQQILEDGTVIQSTDAGVRVITAGGQELTGEAAVAAIQKARAFAVQNQREIYNARKTGTNEADIDTGGAAAASKKAGVLAQEAGLAAWESSNKVQANVANIEEAIAALDRGGKSGVAYKMMPNITEASASLQNAMDRMGLDVIGSVTFGALSEGEMRLAMNTAVPRDLAAPQLREWLARKRDAQIKAASALSQAALYLSNPQNTIAGWMAKQRSGPKQTQPKSDGNSHGAATHRYNPATGKVEEIK